MRQITLTVRHVYGTNIYHTSYDVIEYTDDNGRFVWYCDTKVYLNEDNLVIVQSSNEDGYDKRVMQEISKE